GSSSPTPWSRCRPLEQLPPTRSSQPLPHARSAPRPPRRHRREHSATGEPLAHPGRAGSCSAGTVVGPAHPQNFGAHHAPLLLPEGGTEGAGRMAELGLEGAREDRRIGEAAGYRDIGDAPLLVE